MVIIYYAIIILWSFKLAEFDLLIPVGGLLVM